MTRIFADAGTSWSKLFEVFDKETEFSSSIVHKLADQNDLPLKTFESKSCEGQKLEGSLLLLPTKLLNSYDSIMFDAATGHMSTRKIKPEGKYENELVAMALGGMKIIPEDTATILDLGSRDSKWIKYVNRKYKDLDWNGSCGSGTGATIEMVCNYYDLKPDQLPIEKVKIAVTCGVFGMEKIMDLVAKGTSVDIAVSRYIHGIAFNVWNFAHRSEKLYLSGGLCLNKCFVESLKQYCDVITLGRYVLLEGLY